MTLSEMRLWKLECKSPTQQNKHSQIEVECVYEELNITWHVLHKYSGRAIVNSGAQR